jgi:hypothetical protein
MKFRKFFSAHDASLAVLPHVGIAKPREGVGLVFRPAVVPTPLQVLQGDYRRYLIAQRGLATLSVLGYMKTAALFGTESLRVKTDRCAGLSGSDVAAFLHRAGAGHKPKTVNNTVIELRSFFRFLYAMGLVDTPLWEAALGMASWRGGPLPRRAPAGAANAILASCDGTEQRRCAAVKLIGSPSTWSLRARPDAKRWATSRSV